MSNTNTDKAMAWWESKTTSERSTLWDKHFESIREIRSRRTIILTIWEKEGQPDSSKEEINDYAQLRAILCEAIAHEEKQERIARKLEEEYEEPAWLTKAKSLNL